MTDQIVMIREIGEAPLEPDRVGEALDRAKERLASLQEADGHWCAELEGDSILESEYALTLYFLGRGDGPELGQLANHLRAQRVADGAWGNYPGGPPEVSTSTKAYFVLKLAGDDPEAPHMCEAREAIRRLGGTGACNSYTRLLLSMFGVLNWRDAPAVPPEIILLPRWFYFNIYEMSAWSRAIVVPLSIIWAHKPLCPVAPEHHLDELVVASADIPDAPRLETWRERFWGLFFRGVDAALKVIDDLGLVPLRRIALRRAEAWVVERLEGGGGLGAIFPSIMNTILALVCQGRSQDDPLVAGELEELKALEILDGDCLRLQPCLSPVWDTALAMNALVAARSPAEDPALQRAAAWLLDKEVRRVGDWKHKNPKGRPGGWFFEYSNEFYPDCDDTAEVMIVLSQVAMVDGGDEERRRAALQRALAWQLSMQCRSGGWGAFDKDCDHEVLDLVPFADHNAMLDPPTVDVTARTLEALVKMGLDPSHPAIRKGVAFLWAEQEPEGCWYGRWGANYVYGTWLALSGLRLVGEEMMDLRMRRAVDWFLDCQNDDGGWGESLLSYSDPETKGRGPTTVSQTSWALLGLLAAADLGSARVQSALGRGIDFLLSTQGEDGGWYDEFWTGTGFPKVFYLRYHLYPCYFPLQALAAYRRAVEL